MKTSSSLSASTSLYKRRWSALAVLVGAVLLLAIDGTVLYLAVPSMTADLSPSASQILWIGDIYSLALAGLLVTMGNVADRIGRKRLLLIGTTAFGLASILAAFSTSPEMLIAARFLLGFAGATIMPSTLSIIRNMFTDHTERTRAIAIWSAASGGGLAMGPLVGGILLNNFWWGSVFLINVPIMIAILITGIILLPESKDPNPGRFDMLSVVLSMLAIVPLVYTVKHVVSDGVDVTGALTLTAGLIAGYLFVRRQRRLLTPLLDVTLFRNRAFSGSVLSSFIAIFALTGLLFFFSQYLQLARGFTPLQAGLAEMPATLASIIVIALINPAVRLLGTGKAVALGLLTSSVGLGLIAIAEQAENYLWLALALIPLGLGTGLALTLAVDAVVSAVPEEKAGSASAVSETAYELGVAFGIAILGSLVSLSYRGSLVLPDGTSEATGETARDSLAQALTVFGPGSPGAEAAKESFVFAMQTTSIVAAIVTLIAAIAAWKTIPSTKPEPATAGAPNR